MSEEISDILATCLEQMEAGASLESCLVAYPQYAAELEPLLRMTQQMQPLAKAGPRPTFARMARWQLENQLSTSRKAVTFERQGRHTKTEPKFLPQRRFSMSALQIFIAAVLALSAMTGGTAYAANASHPGDALHGLDLAIENAQLHLAPDVATKVQLRLQFASERLVEAQATFEDNDVTDGLEAVNEYGSEISAAAQLIGGEGGADKDALAALLEAAHGIHQQVLTQLLDTVPDQARDGIQNALEASSHTGKPEDVGEPDQTGKPENTGKPDGTGKPEGTGSPNGNGQHDNTGKPDQTGKPIDVGNPDAGQNSNGVSAPGLDISACAKSISSEDAQAVAALAQQHSLDYQSVLQNFCVLGTLEKVKAMVSELKGPPDNAHGGPPANVSNGPPVGVPAGQPTSHPGKP